MEETILDCPWCNHGVAVRYEGGHDVYWLYHICKVIGRIESREFKTKEKAMKAWEKWKKNKVLTPHKEK